MLSAAAESIASMLGSLTGEVVLAGQVRSHSYPSLLSVPFCHWTLSAPPSPRAHGDLPGQVRFLAGATSSPRCGLLRLAGIGGFPPAAPPLGRGVRGARLVAIRMEAAKDVAVGDAAREQAHGDASEAWLQELQVSSGGKFSSVIICCSFWIHYSYGACIWPASMAAEGRCGRTG